MVGRFGSGRAVPRIEDPALVRGLGRFVDDVAQPGALHLVFLRSPWAHGRLRAVDVAAARALPDVVAVLTGADAVADGLGTLPAPTAFKRPDGSPAASPPRPVLAVDTVRFVGEPVAAVVARSRAAALAARDAIVLEVDDLPAVATLADATADGAPLVWPAATGNVAAEMRHGDAAATEAAFARAAHVVALDLHNQRLAPTPMEPRGALALRDPATGRLTLRLASQMPSGARDTLCDAVLKIPRDQVRVVVGDVGGGFGMKTGLYAEDAVVAWAARRLGADVRWTAERAEEFLGAVHGRDLGSHAELALDADGRALALRVRAQANVGAYPGPAAVAIQVLIGPWVATSIYDIPVVDLAVRAVLTHTAPTGAYRGAGRPENIYVIERLMDAAARRLGLDPAELRRRNMVRPEQMPYRNAVGQRYDSGRFAALLDRGLALADWAGFDARAAASRARGRLRGRGLATFLEWTSGNAFEERVTVNVSADGEIEIWTATQAMGQGIATSYAQLAVDVFQVPIERIRIVQGDTDRGSGFGSAGSRSLFTAGSALQVAAGEAVDQGRALAADALEAAAEDIEYADGRYRVAGTDRGIDLFAVAARLPARALHVDSKTRVDGPSWPNGCHVCEVEVDPDTGSVVVDHYVSMNDVGRVVSPAIVIGQLEGGAVQGIGQALCEQVVHDASGQLLTGSLIDYALPRAGIVRRFTTAVDESTPCLTNPLGSKGVGELGTIGATPATVLAVVDALHRAEPAFPGAGARSLALQMPLTPEKVWRALHGIG